MVVKDIDYEAVPGNSHLVDLDGHLPGRLSKGNSNIVLLPTPSDDYDDPLNWSPRRKWLAVFCNVVYTFGVGIPSAAIYSVLTNIAAETNITLGQLNAGTGYMFLFFGIGCIIFQPIALQYGKRPVYLFSVFSTCLICVWAPYSKSNGEWIGNKILQGFVGSPIESLCEITMSDIFFEHERAKGMGIYAVALFTANYMAPMLAGFVNDGMGWKWVLWMSSVFSAVCFVFLFFFMEETNYDRNSKVKSLTTIEGIETSENNSNTTEYKEKHRRSGFGSPKSTNKPDNNNFDAITNYEELNIDRTQKTFRDKLSLTGGFKNKFLLVHYFKTPFKMIRFPSVLWAGFLYGSTLVFFNLLNATEATILGGAPYNFSPAMCGLAYLSPTLFSVFFFFTAGTLSDFLKVHIARKRNGSSIPEDRLWVLIVYMILGFLASIGWGVGAYYGAHWMVLVISMGVLGGLNVFGCTSACTYCSDTYHELDTEAMVVVIVIRNIMSFAASYGLTDWVLNMGYKNAFISSGCILFFCNSTFLIMRITGPYWRAKTRYSYWKLVEFDRDTFYGSN